MQLLFEIRTSFHPSLYGTFIRVPMVPEALRAVVPVGQTPLGCRFAATKRRLTDRLPPLILRINFNYDQNSNFED